MGDLVFKVSVQGPGVSIEREVGEAVLPRILALVLSPATSTFTEIDAGTKQSTGSGATIGEFLSELNVNTNPDRLAGIALFVRDALGRDTVPRDEIPAWFQRAGQPAPKNLHRDLKTAVAQRLIAEDHARAGEFLVTETGIRSLRGGAAPEGGSSGTRKRSPTRRTRSSASLETGSGANTDGPTAKVQELIGEDWFGAPRTVAELIQELAARGAHYKAADLTYQMQQFAKDKKLRRKKQLPAGGKREVWHYSNW